MDHILSYAKFSVMYTLNFLCSLLRVSVKKYSHAVLQFCALWQLLADPAKCPWMFPSHVLLGGRPHCCTGAASHFTLMLLQWRNLVVSLLVAIQREMVGFCPLSTVILLTLASHTSFHPPCTHSLPQRPQIQRPLSNVN